ncbi:threo-3-hydroxy-L-aspartate ammonia-lyase [Pseudomonas yamanorum]|uniref:threo-3-hydroxy-L-aspartate ammonia-lyase n=1 Tax=Pseudomonas yamanorum TaxID=515393 RepID=UPI0015A455EE|nr:threo-3-hydroxy-L-aspartate ammonia-lyase [Pseudomonas yamanorum]NVZ83934.1 threo-3-hydroxy-L-aspartate ammonia-lyase [Pseudomonas yamanorum]
MQSLNIPTFFDVAEAASRLAGFANKTPVFTSRTLDEEIGAQIFFKCENFQRTGSFKFRGAFNALSKLDAEQKNSGVVAFSSGNHAQGIALAASLLGVPATIVMPTDAPASKVAATREYGAAIQFYDRYSESREDIAKFLAQEQGRVVIPSYDHPDILAGQGTAAKELIESVGDLDVLIVGLGGGGMLAGSTLAVRALAPKCKIFGVEPEAGNDGQQSFRSGQIVHIETPQTIADGAQTQHLGNYTFPIILNGVNDILTASDSELTAAMNFFAMRMKMIVEPTGCLGLAALRKHKEKFKGCRIGVILTGGNIDTAKFVTLIQQ